jgi:hypothetical protein
MPRGESNNNSSSNTGKIIAAAAASIVAAGAVWYFLIRKKNHAETLDEEDNFIAKPTKQQTGTSPSSPAAKSGNEGMKEVGKSGASSTDDLALQHSFGGDMLYKEATSGFQMPGEPDAEGNVSFPHLHFAFKLEPKWIIAEEVSPVPSVATIQLQHESTIGKDIHQAMPGDFPTCVIAVEDVSSEGATVEDVKNRSIQMITMQFHMMTQGQARPQMDKDIATNVGPFKHYTEFTIHTPFFNLTMIYYLAISQHRVYNLQFMAKPELVGKYRTEIANMARSVVLLSDPAAEDFTQTGYLIVPIYNGDGQVKVPPSWKLSDVESKLPVSIVPPETIIGKMKTSSSLRPETVLVLNKAPNVEGLEKTRTEMVCSDASVEFSEYKLQGPAGHTAQHLKVCHFPSNKNVWVVSGPTRISDQVMLDNTLGQVCKSVSTTEPAPNKDGGYTFVSTRFGFSFKAKKGGKIMESSIGEKVIMYGPLGGMDPSVMMNQQSPPTEEQMRAAQEQPIVTIRCGDPETDPDCKETLAEWKRNVEQQAKSGDAPLENIRLGKIGGRDFLLFDSKDMVEVGEGAKEERMAKMFVCIHERKSTMVRWEAPTGVFRKYEHMMNEMLESLEVF